MSARTDVLLWAQRVIGRRGRPAHLILEIAADAGLDAAQAAFHRIARMAHPDLHRTTLSSEELDLVTTAYGRAAAAYQEIRVQYQDRATARIRPVRPPGSSLPVTASSATSTPTSPIPVAPSTPTGEPAEVSPVLAMSESEARGVGTPMAPPAGRGAASPVGAMTSKALIHYRKAELCLRRGELTEAVLHLKLAIASDPQSAFLRTALAQVQSELGKKP